MMPTLSRWRAGLRRSSMARRTNFTGSRKRESLMRRGTEMRVWMPTSNDYVWAAEASLRLLDKYWPDHPLVDLTCFETVPLCGFMSKRADTVKLGNQSELSWTQAAIRYLEEHAPESFLLMLDDYAISRPVDDDHPIRCGFEVIKRYRHVSSF